jgi:large subunit ribosomal protein L22
MEAKAVLRKTRLVPRKARLTMDLIRGKEVGEAIAILKNTNNKSARVIIKVLDSAIANATNNLELDINKLYVSEALIDEGPTMKRMKPRARGAADIINKRTSHVTVKVSERD